MDDLKEEEFYREFLRSHKAQAINNRIRNIKSSLYKREQSQLAKAEQDNKKLVSLLNRKMFKGFLKIKASKAISNRNQTYSRKLEQKVMYPFEDNYEIVYKRKYLTKNEPVLSKLLNVMHSKQVQTETDKKNDCYLFYNPHKNFFITDKFASLSFKGNEKNIEDYRTWQIMNQIFHNGIEEAGKYSSLPFFALNLCKSKPRLVKGNKAIIQSKIIKDVMCINKSNEKNERIHSIDCDQVNAGQCDFLFKISHPEKFSEKTLKNRLNFRTNPGLMRLCSARLYNNRRANANEVLFQSSSVENSSGYGSNNTNTRGRSAYNKPSSRVQVSTSTGENSNHKLQKNGVTVSNDLYIATTTNNDTFFSENIKAKTILKNK